MILKFFSHWEAWIGWSKRPGWDDEGSSSLQFLTHKWAIERKEKWERTNVCNFKHTCSVHGHNCSQLRLTCLNKVISSSRYSILLASIQLLINQRTLDVCLVLLSIIQVIAWVPYHLVCAESTSLEWSRNAVRGTKTWFSRSQSLHLIHGQGTHWTYRKSHRGSRNIYKTEKKPS